MRAQRSTSEAWMARRRRRDGSILFEGWYGFGGGEGRVRVGLGARVHLHDDGEDIVEVSWTLEE